MTILSDVAFDWALTLITGVVAGVWFFWDAFKLARLRNADRSDPIVRDKQFGYVMGIVIGLLGVLGSVKHHL